MPSPQIRGVELTEEVKSKRQVVDPRPLSQKILEWMRTPTNLASSVFFIAFAAYFVPALCDLFLLIAAALTVFGMRQTETLPIKFPAQSGLLDVHEPDPSKGGKPDKAKGIFFLGNDIKTGKEVWLSNSDCRQHFLLLGTTGTGKTEALLGFASNAVSWGSGCLFIDGKGDVSTFASFYALARRYGREDDILVINYMTGNQDVGSGGGRLRSNTMNPFSHGASDTLTNMIVSLMDDVGGDGAMWKGRATAMLTGTMRALIWLRDQNRIDLNVAEIRDHLNLKRIIDLCDPSKYPDLPQHIRHNVKSYLLSLPGFQEEKGYKQGQTTLDQHGYLEMQFTRILGSLADVYGYIFQTPFGEVDMSDVVLNRRLLLIMLPALEKASDEIANLGKIVVATLRGMMGSTLGSEIEGTWQDVVVNRLTESPSPFIVILDEVGYYMVDGMDLMAAQARSLGFSLVFAGQDLNAMKRISEKVFGSVLGNTRTKVLLGTEDTETMELAAKLGGKSLRTHMGGFTGQPGEFGRSYADSMDASIAEVERIHSLDVKAQGPGEAHVLFAEKLVRVNMFFSNPKGSLNPRKLKLRTNHFVTVGHPDVAAILSQQRLPDIIEKLCDPEFGKMMRNDAENALRNITLENELLSYRQTVTEAKSKQDKLTSTVDPFCVAIAKLTRASEIETETYSDRVRSSQSANSIESLQEMDVLMADKRAAQAARPRNIVNPHARSDRPSEFERPSGFTTPERDFQDRRVVEPPAPPKPPQPRRQETKPYKPTKVDRNVKHGIEADGGFHDLVDKLPAVPGVLDALAQLDADHEVTTKNEISLAVDEALQFAADSDDLGYAKAATPELIRKADESTRGALPEFEFSDDDDEGDGSEDSTLAYLDALVQADGED